MPNDNKHQPPANYPVSDLALVTYLNLRGFAPTGRISESGKATVLFPRNAALEMAVIDFNTVCLTCGVTFSDLTLAGANARKQLLDGTWDWERGHEDTKRGGR